jgi:small subunit ribosomal protein S6
MREYELAVLYHPDLEVDLTKAEERVTTIVKNSKGKVKATDNWGKRKLAYPIGKLEHAVYVFYTLDLPAERAQKVEQTLNITDEVIRFLLVKIDPKEKAKAEEAKAEKEEKAKKHAAHAKQEDDKDDK